MKKTICTRNIYLTAVYLALEAKREPTVHELVAEQLMLKAKQRVVHEAGKEIQAISDTLGLSVSNCYRSIKWLQDKGLIDKKGSNIVLCSGLSKPFNKIVVECKR